MPKKSIIAVAVFAAAALGTAGFFIWRDLKSPLGEKPGFFEDSKPGFKESAGDTELNALKKAALERAIPAGLPAGEAGQESAVSELKTLSSQLAREPNYLQGWLQVGILRKFFGDYEGASLAWQYASLMRPTDFIAFSNLGDLYHYYLKDYPTAEKYLRRAVDIKPDYVAGYKNLFDLYTLSYKEKESLAEPVLLEGIQKNPGDKYLQQILNSYRAGEL